MNLKGHTRAHRAWLHLVATALETELKEALTSKVSSTSWQLYAPACPHPYVFPSCIAPCLAFLVTGRKWQSDSMALLRLGYNLSLIHAFSLGWLGLGEVMSRADPWRGPHGKEVKPPTKSHMSELGGGFSSHQWVFRDDIPGQQFDPVKGPEPELDSEAIPRFLILSKQMR